MKKKLSSVIFGAALFALFMAPVSALGTNEVVENKHTLSCLTGAGVSVEEAENHIYDTLEEDKESVAYVYSQEDNGVDRKYLKDVYHVFKVYNVENGELGTEEEYNVLVNKKTLKLYTYDSNYNLIPMR